ncbi:MAG: hypothetical protein E6H10_13330 [Bacteroidetes bacterium]|nr:MAG: hypothetical protein E6H10_13330 [Bacteroidota bacterium]
MARILTLIILLWIFESCRSARNSNRVAHPVPASFDDTINATIQRLNNCQTCNYIVYKVKYGNCFGPSLSGFSHIIWTNGIQAELRNIEAKQNNVTDKVSNTVSPMFFDLLVNNQVDTIKTLPKPGVTMDPVSYCDILIKRGALIFNKRFEMTPFFSSQDTLHPLFVFVKKLIQ